MVIGVFLKVACSPITDVVFPGGDRWVTTVVFVKVIRSSVTDSVFFGGDRYVFVVFGLVTIDGRSSSFSVVITCFCVTSVDEPDCRFKGELVVDCDPILKIHETIMIEIE